MKRKLTRYAGRERSIPFHLAVHTRRHRRTVTAFVRSCSGARNRTPRDLGRRRRTVVRSLISRDATLARHSRDRRPTERERGRDHGDCAGATMAEKWCTVRPRRRSRGVGDRRVPHQRSGRVARHPAFVLVAEIDIEEPCASGETTASGYRGIGLGRPTPRFTTTSWMTRPRASNSSRVVATYPSNCCWNLARALA